MRRESGRRVVLPPG